MRLGPVELRRHAAVETPTQPNLRALEEILEGLEVIEVNVQDGYVVASKQLAGPIIDEDDRPKVRELGSSGTKWRRVLGGQEYNPDLQGQNGIRTFDRMRRGDAAVTQALKIAKTPVLVADWWVDPADPENEQDVMIADFVSHCLFDWQTVGFTQTLTEALTMLDYGYSFFEKVFRTYEWNGENRVIWQKLAPRAIEDVQEWEYDAHGGPSYVVMQNFEGGEAINISIDDLLVFTHQMEAGNIEGISMLRPMYKHWYYKENLYKIDAIQKERHGIGIPVITLPPGWTPADKQLADELGRNLRTNEWAHIVLPPMWTVEFAALQVQNVDVMKSANHHDKKIMDSALAGFAYETEDQGGDAKVLLDLFMKSTRHVANGIREVFNKFGIPQLVAYNWDVDEYPTLRARHIGEVADNRTLSFAVRNLIGSGALIPDDELEDYLREINDLPRRDPTTARQVETPQLPDEEDEAPSANPPRQSQARNMRNRPGRNAGKDNSGGK